MGFALGFDMFRIMFSIVFMLVIGMFIMNAIRGISQWNKNNNSPRLTVEAAVVAKRTNVTHHHHGEQMDITIIIRLLRIMLHFRCKAEIAWNYMCQDMSMAC